MMTLRGFDFIKEVQENGSEKTGPQSDRLRTRECQPIIKVECAIKQGPCNKMDTINNLDG